MKTLTYINMVLLAACLATEALGDVPELDVKVAQIRETFAGADMPTPTQLGTNDENVIWRCEVHNGFPQTHEQAEFAIYFTSSHNDIKMHSNLCVLNQRTFVAMPSENALIASGPYSVYVDIGCNVISGIRITQYGELVGEINVNQPTVGSGHWHPTDPTTLPIIQFGSQHSMRNGWYFQCHQDPAYKVSDVPKLTKDDCPSPVQTPPRRPIPTDVIHF